jgi:small subunit ribosomal protein S20
LPAKKSFRQSVKRNQRNRSARTETRTIIGRALRAVDSGDAADAQAAVRLATSVMDRAVGKGILHKNNAARRKSRMAARLNNLAQAQEA